jgi:holo-[acyl-carrier protein] synthase
MIYGIGNDIIETRRLKKGIESGRFRAFCFSGAERDAFGDNIQKLAGCFAAKEALSKALGTGVRGFSLDELSVLRDDIGRPFFVFEGKIKEIMDGNSLAAHLALTNSSEYVLATVVLEVRG